MKCKFLRFHRGFTLVEMVLSMAVMTVLLGGIASALVIAGRAVPGRDTTYSYTMDGYYAADRLAGELYAAQSFSVMSPTQITFTVADRNNDGAPETISYTWSGIPGTSLTRQYNTDTAVALADSVNEFALTYDKAAEAQVLPGGPNESAETLLISYDSTSGLTKYAIDSSHWAGQFFKPVLSADATSWKITRVKFQAKIEGANGGTTKVQLRTSNASNLPTSTAMDEVSLVESSLSSTYTWREAQFSKASGISPTQGVCLVLQWVSDAHSCAVQYRKGGVAMFNSNLVETANGENGWTTTVSDSLNFYVYGTVTAPSPPQTLLLYRLKGIQIKIRIGGDTSSRVQTAVQILNQPEVTGT